jgi:hypothetical protein
LRLFIFCEIDNNQYRSGVVKNNSLISSLDKGISSLLRLFISCEIDNNQYRSGVVTGVDTSKTTINTAVVSLPVSTPQKQQSIPQYTQRQRSAESYDSLLSEYNNNSLLTIIESLEIRFFAMSSSSAYFQLEFFLFRDHFRRDEAHEIFSI